MRRRYVDQSTFVNGMSRIQLHAKGATSTQRRNQILIFAWSLRSCSECSMCLPLQFQLCQEIRKSLIAAEVVEIGVPFEQRIAREAVSRRGFEPFDRLGVPVHTGVRVRDVVCRMMKMSETSSSL